MTFFKALLETASTFDPKGQCYANRYTFRDTTNPKYPTINIWNNGEVEIQDPEGRSCFADDETMLKYCNMKDTDLMLVEAKGYIVA